MLQNYKNVLEIIKLLHSKEHTKETVANIIDNYSLVNEEEKIALLDIYPELKDITLIIQDKEGITKDIISKLNVEKEKTIFNVAEYIKSSICHKKVNKNINGIINENSTLYDTQLGSILKDLTILPSIKQEELSGYLGIVMSGILHDNSEKLNKLLSSLNEDEKIKILNGLVEENRKIIQVNYQDQTITDKTGLIKTRRGVEGGSKIDRFFINKDVGYCVFATSGTDTSEQHATPFECVKVIDKEKENIGCKEIQHIYLVNGYFASENKTTKNNTNIVKFKSQFSNEIQKEELDLINHLPFLSLIGNKELEFPRVNNNINISDIASFNVFIVGADSLELHNKFAYIKKQEEPIKTQCLLETYLDYADRITNILLKLDTKNPDAKTINANIFYGYNRFIEGLVTNFNELNLNRKLTDDELKKLDFLSLNVEKLRTNNQEHNRLFGDLKRMIKNIEDNHVGIIEDYNSSKQNQDFVLAKNKKTIIEDNFQITKEIKEELRKTIFSACRKRYSDFGKFIEQAHKCLITDKKTTINKEPFYQNYLSKAEQWSISDTHNLTKENYKKIEDGITNYNSLLSSLNKPNIQMKIINSGGINEFLRVEVIDLINAGLDSKKDSKASPTI